MTLPLSSVIEDPLKMNQDSKQQEITLDELTDESILHDRLCSHAEENPRQLWDMLKVKYQQQIREEVIRSLSSTCLASEDGYVITWSPSKQINRRMLFNILDSWWENVNWDDPQSKFQIQMEELVEYAKYQPAHHYNEVHGLLRLEVEDDECPINPVIVDWIIERVVRERTDFE